MAEEHFTKIGSQIGDLYWFLIVIGLVGLIMSFSRKYRWTGAFAALSSVIALTLNIPTPFYFVLLVVLLTAGSNADLVAKSGKEARTIWSWFYPILVCAALCVFVILWEPRKEITLNSNGLVSTASFHKPFSASRKDVRAVEVIDEDGSNLEWRFMKPTQGSENPFLANMLYNELYWDHAGHILTGRQVASKVADWAAVKFVREPYASAH